MRYKEAAKSAASSPPAPALISTITVSILLTLFLQSFLFGQSFSEFLDLTQSINNFFFAGVEGMALGAYFNFNVFLGGTNRKSIAARALNAGIRIIFGMDVFFHINYLIRLRAKIKGEWLFL
jgi:hypothetical protein